MSRRVTETLYFVSDVEAAIEQYVEGLGFRLVEVEDWGFALLEAPGGAHVGLLSVRTWDPGWKPGAPIPPPRVSIQTDDIDGEVARLAAAGVWVSTVRGEPGTVRVATIRDLDGNRLFLWDDGSGSLGDGRDPAAAEASTA